MKKTSIFFALFALLILPACTLSLEVPEEPNSDASGDSTTQTGDGITSPRTEVNEYGIATYQFKKGVRVLDETYRPYLLLAKKNTREVPDSVQFKTYLYFANNTPADMIPQRGELIGAHHLESVFDFTLIDKVDAVEREGDMFKVISHSVELNDIFETFNAELFLDLVNDGADSINSRSGECGVHFEGAYYRQLHSRSDDEDIMTGDKPLATVCIASDGSKKPQQAFPLLGSLDWTKPVNVDGKLGNVKKSLDAGNDCNFFMGKQIHSTFNSKISLTGIDVKMANTVQTALGIEGRKFKGTISQGVAATEGSDVESDGFFPTVGFKHYEYQLQVPDLIGIPVPVGPVLVTICFGFSIIEDMAFDLQASDSFHFENAITDKNFVFGASDKDAKVKKKNVPSRYWVENDGTVKFKHGSRTTFEIIVGFTLGVKQVESAKALVATQTLKGIVKKSAVEALKTSTISLPSFKPLVIRVLFTYKDVNYSDNSKVIPSTLKYNKRTYYCGGNASRTSSLSIGVGARFLQLSGLGGAVGDLGDALADEIGQENINNVYNALDRLRSALSTPTANGTIWSSTSSKFATFNCDFDYEKEDFQIKCEVTLEPNKVEDTHLSDETFANRIFSNLQLFVLDMDDNVIAVGKPSGSAPGYLNSIVEEENAYEKIYAGKDYEYEFTLPADYALKGFKLVPAYCEYYKENGTASIVGWSRTYMYDIPRTVYSKGTIGAIKYPKFRRFKEEVENNSGNNIAFIFEGNYVIDADDNDDRTDSNIYAEIHGLDQAGNVVLEGTMTFKGDKNVRAGAIKGLCTLMIDNSSTYVDKVSVRLYYKTKKQMPITTYTIQIPHNEIGYSDVWLISKNDLDGYFRKGYSIGYAY